MKRASAFAALTALILSVAIAAPTDARSGKGGGGQFIVVGFRELPPGLRAGDAFMGARVERVDRVLRFARVRTGRPAAFRARAAGDARVRYVEPDPEMPLIDLVPNDPRYGEQYGPQHVRAPEAWDTTLGDRDEATLCSVDTGVRNTHEEFPAESWRGGWDFYNGDGDPWDDNGHGTWTTGIGAAAINNDVGIAGLANVGISAAKVLSASGRGAWSTVASGIRWCADNAGPRAVINMSLGGLFGSSVLQDAVAYAEAKGALQVAAAGNGGPCSNCVSYPARYSQVMAVSCTDASKTQCSFSSDGPQTELAAPGSGILSLWNASDSDYESGSGTSGSTPHVAGVAALVWSQETGLSNAQLRGLLQDNAQDLGSPGWDEQFGYGLVDAKATLDAAGGVEPPPPPAPPPPPPPTPSSALFEDFDDGVANGWTLQSLWNVSSRCTIPPSTPNYLGFHDSGCDYATGKRVRGGATVEVDLSGTTSATLTFQQYRFVEFYPFGAYDVMRVQAATGRNWTTLARWDSRDFPSLLWEPVSIDLDAFAGGVVKLRFYFDSVDRWTNNYPGWYIDDVEVTAS